MFIIARGIVQGSQPDQGKGGPVEMWGPGDIFGNTSTIGRNATATHNRAMSPCFIFGLRVRDLEGLPSICPTLATILDAARDA